MNTGIITQQTMNHTAQRDSLWQRYTAAPISSVTIKLLKVITVMCAVYLGTYAVAVNTDMIPTVLICVGFVALVTVGPRYYRTGRLVLYGFLLLCLLGLFTPAANAALVVGYKAALVAALLCGVNICCTAVAGQLRSRASVAGSYERL